MQLLSLGARTSLLLYWTGPVCIACHARQQVHIHVSGRGSFGTRSQLCVLCFTSFSTKTNFDSNHKLHQPSVGLSNVGSSGRPCIAGWLCVCIPCTYLCSTCSRTLSMTALSRICTAIQHGPGITKQLGIYSQLYGHRLGLHLLWVPHWPGMF